MLQKKIHTLLAGAIGLLLASAASADVPEFGTVTEGQSVPGGIALWSTRAYVESVYGPPTRCQSVQSAGDAASCSWILEDYLGQGGQVQSQVTTNFRGPNGGSASNDPNDVVSSVSWRGLDGWVTTRGVNTLSALNNQDDVIALYPNGVVTQQSMFDTHLIAYEDGFSVSWHTEYLSGFTSVRMSVFEPREPPPPREPSVHVSEISLDLYKRQVIGKVRVLNDLNWKVRGATVHATWTLPDGTTQAIEGTTDSFGLVFLVVSKARKGTYTLTIDNVMLEDHPFNVEDSVLSATIVKTR